MALTLGAEGTFLAIPDSGECVASRPVKAIDATAAGDTFNGAFLARLVAGDDPFAAAYASTAAAPSTQGYGAVAPMPRKGAVEEFLAERG